MAEQVVWAGRYAVYDELATGGMATVYLAARMGPASDLPRIVALKKLAAQYTKQPEFVAMFLDEAHLAARIRHPNVVTTYEFLRTDDGLAIVMDFVLGQSLLQLLRTSLGAGTPAPLPVAAAIIAGALDGLHAAHEVKDDSGRTLGLVHRDMSPHNVIVGKDGIARVIDFGIAKASGRLQTTDVGVLKGKFAYMAPEQIRGAAVDRTTDIYSAGAVFWEALTGRRLFRADADQEALTLRGSGEVKPARPSTIAPGVPRDVDDIVMRALDVDPAKRFLSALEMAEAIRARTAIASAAEVAAWVEALAGGDMALLDARRTEIERSFGDPPAASAQPVAGPAPPTLVDIPDLIPGPRDGAVPPATPGPDLPPSDRNDVFAGRSADPIALDLEPLAAPPPAQRPPPHARDLDGARRAPRPRRRQRSVALRVGLVAAALCAGLGIAALRGPQALRAHVVAAAAARGLTVEVGRTDLRRGGLTLRDVRVTLPACAEASFSAAEVDVDLDIRGSPRRVSFNAFDAVVRGSPTHLAGCVSEWQRAAREPLPLQGAGGHVVWSKVFGAGGEIEALGVTIATPGPPEAAIVVDAPSLVLNLPRGHVGPWRGHIESSQTEIRAGLALDPTTPDGPPSASALYRPVEGTSVALNIPRGSTFKVGMPAELFGFSSGMSLGASLRARLPPRGPMEAEGGLELYGLRVTSGQGGSVPVDLAVEGRVKGDPTLPLAVLGGKLTLGRATTPVTGTVKIEQDGIRIELDRPTRAPGPAALTLDTRDWTSPAPVP